MIKKIPYRLGQFAPDQTDYDSGMIEVLQSAVPMYGGYRGIQMAEQRSNHKEADEIATGAHAHLLSSDFTDQQGRAQSDYSNGVYVCNEDSVDTDLWESIKESTPDDTKYNLWLENDQNPTADRVSYNIQDIEDPTVYTDVFLKIRYRGWIDNGVGNLEVILGQGSNDVSSFNIDTTTTPEAATGVWLYKEVELNAGEVGGITMWDALVLAWQGSVSGMSADNPLLYHKPFSDLSNSDHWTDNADGSSNLWSRINDVEEPPDDPANEEATYIQTPDLLGSSTKKYEGTLDTKGRHASVHYHYTAGSQPDLVFKIHAKVLDETTTKMTVSFKRNWAGSEGEGTWDEQIVDHVFTAADRWETVTKTLAFADHQNYDIDDFDFRVAFTHEGGTATPQTTLPNADVTDGNFEDQGGSNVNMYADIADSDDSTYLTFPASNDTESYKFTIASMDDPESYADDEVKFTVRTKTTSGNQPNVRLKVFYNGGDSSYTLPWQKVPKTITDMEFGLTSEQAASLDWGTDFTVQIQYSAYRVIRLYEVQLDAGAVAGKGYVSDVWIETEGYQGFEVSWMGLSVPAVTEEYIGDQQKVYVGSSTHLFEVSESGLWTDISRAAGDYNAVDTKESQAWDFCSWGGNVIATNYEDAVQLLDLEGGATVFTDLMAAGAYPTDEVYDVRAKFCGIVQDHLVLCNIGAVEDFDVPTAYTGAYSYSVWHSKFNDPTAFAIGDFTNLSDISHLRATRGEITGFQGGEYGTIWKRDSIYRMSWTGGVLVFRFDLLADGIGTGHPGSIVARDQDLFFYGHNDFYVMPNGGKPVPLGIGKIQSLITEVGFDERAFNRNGVERQIENDLRISGAYDQFTGLIFWAVDNKVANSTWKHKTDILVFNPSDGRWGYIRDTSFDTDDYGIGVLTSTPNIPSDELNIMNNLIVIANEEAGASDRMHMVKFTSDDYSNLDITTGIITSQSLEMEGTMIVSAIRPFYDRLGTTDAGSNIFEPEYEGTIYASPDPLMLDNVATATFSSANRNENGWAQLSNILNGEFIKVEFSVPSYNIYDNRVWTYDGVVKSMLGLQFELRQGGMR